MLLLPHSSSTSAKQHQASGSSRDRTAGLVRFGLLGLFALLTAGVAGAASFTITLANGTSFETRYRPVTADWDDTIALIRTDQGNWIALQKDEIVDVASQAEISGFGYQVDTQTLYLGWSPNDLLDEGDGDDGEEGSGGDGEARPYYENEELYDAPADSGFGLEQFVDVPGVGDSIGSVDIGPTVQNRDDG